MAVCPNCGRKLHFSDWRPECPGCGVNLNYFQSNEKLLEDSEKAEIEHAHFQPHIDRAKAAFVGSKLTIVRIILSLLPAGGLFLPLGILKGAENVSFNAISVYNYVSKADIGALLKGVTSFDPFCISVLTLLLSVVLILVNLIALIASNGKHGKVRTFILNGVMLGFAVISAVCFAAANGASAVLEKIYTGSSLGAGAFVYISLIAVLFGWNIMLFTKGMEIKYTKCLIGGLPSEEYFSYVEQGLSKDEIYRKMLVAIAKLEAESEGNTGVKEAENNG